MLDTLLLRAYSLPYFDLLYSTNIVKLNKIFHIILILSKSKIFQKMVFAEIHKTQLSPIQTIIGVIRRMLDAVECDCDHPKNGRYLVARNTF